MIACNFAYLDEQTKRMIRRATLNAIAIPGYQAPFASQEMPMPYGWGTGGVQLTASVLGPDDTLKVIDQGGRLFVCSDADYCEGRRAGARHSGGEEAAK